MIISAWLLFSFCNSRRLSPSEVFSDNKSAFRQVVLLRDSLLRRYPTCHSLKFTVTAKSFWQECDSVKTNPDLPSEFLTMEEKAFLSEVMNKCGITKLKMTPSTIRFIFPGGEVIRTDSVYASYSSYALDNLFYLWPENERVPD